ncbi:T9SS type A sorting domain-containing protein, partial [bacterium]|nr:T9SS type A sorting domain-containing protein [bacterium]
EAKIYKLQPGFQEVVFGLNNGTVYKHYSGRWGDNHQITDPDFPVNVAVKDMAIYEKGDGDNGDEVIIAFANGKVFHQGGGSSNDAHMFMNRGISANAVEGANLDGIGSDELIVGFQDGKIYKSNGTWGQEIQITDPDFPPNVAVKDIAMYEKGDGDTADELIIAFADGKVLHQGSGNSNDAHMFMNRGISANAVAGANLDGNGTDELIVGFQDGKIYKSNGMWGQETQITDPEFPANVAVTDIAVYERGDLDNAEELIIAFSDGKVFIQGSANSNDAHMIINRGISANGVAGADLDGDGKDEIIVGFQDGKLYVNKTGLWGQNDLVYNGTVPVNSVVEANLDGNSILGKVVEQTVDQKGTGSKVGSFSLLQNYPNPFNPATTIRYLLLQPAFVTLKVYNLKGQEIETLVAGTQEAGEYNVHWNPTNLSSGVYIYQLRVGELIETKKLIFMK